MAVWQYRGELIPEFWLIEKHGVLPATLDDYCMTEDMDLDSLEDPTYWLESHVPVDVLDRVRAILPQANSWSKDALMFGDEKSTDLAIWYHGKEIEMIYFRWDLRDPDLEVLAQIVRLAKRLGSVIVSGDRGTVVEADLGAVLRDVQASSAYRFCRDPEGFLRGLSPGSDKG